MFCQIFLQVEADHSVFRYLLYEALKVGMWVPCVELKHRIKRDPTPPTCQVPDFEYVTKWFTKAVRHGVVPETPIATWFEFVIG